MGAVKRQIEGARADCPQRLSRFSLAFTGHEGGECSLSRVSFSARLGGQRTVEVSRISSAELGELNIHLLNA